MYLTALQIYIVYPHYIVMISSLAKTKKQRIDGKPRNKEINLFLLGTAGHLNDLFFPSKGNTVIKKNPDAGGLCWN